MYKTKLGKETLNRQLTLFTETNKIPRSILDYKNKAKIISSKKKSSIVLEYFQINFNKR